MRLEFIKINMGAGKATIVKALVKKYTQQKVNILKVL
jgi:tRNA A37 threonylcarbamoyladenosine biosynthesis protein TsaE